jgi:hypothetical protein
MSLRPFLAALVAALVFAAPAGAAWFPGESIDGPSPDIVGFGDIDLARDGTGGLVYLKNDGGVPHVYLSRHYAGVWHAPERVDAGIEAAATEPRIAAGDDHRLAIVWVSGGRLHGAVAPGGPPQALPGPQVLHEPEPLRSVRHPAVDLGINGTAYATFTVAGGAASPDVRGVRLQGTTWEPVAAPLDVGIDQAAGDGAGRSRVAVSAEGNAVAVWGEAHPDGRARVYGRRLFGLQVSVAPQEISLPEFEGGLGGAADSPDIDIEDDGSYAWVVFRQEIGGRSRALARRLVGSQFEPATAVDNGEPAETARIGLSGRGVGISAVGTASRAVQVALIERDVFGPTFRVDSTGSTEPPLPVATTSERDESVMAWRSTSGPGASEVRARYRPDAKAFDPELVLSVPAFGPAAPDGLEVTESRLGDFAIGFLQGDPSARRVVVAVWDRPPGRPFGLSSDKPRRLRDVSLKWRPGTDLWGAQRFRVMIDGKPVGETDQTEFPVPDTVSDGTHRWQAVAIDRRGQESPMRSKIVRVDGRAPRLKVKITGRRVAGNPLRVTAKASDSGFGMGRVFMTWGDKSGTFEGRTGVHIYRRGRFTLIVRAVDRAGNVTRHEFRLRIR